MDRKMEQTPVALTNKNWIRKSFVPEVSSIQREVDCVRSSIDGQEIRSFYESVVSSSETNEDVSRREERSTRNVNDEKKVTERKGGVTAVPSIHRFLQFAQNGQITKLRDCLESGMDINGRDDYGWTAIMCAASNGSKEAVEFLLRNKADATLVERSGRSAAFLARMSGHSHVVKLLTKERNVVRGVRTPVSEAGRLRASSSSSGLKSETADSFHCAVCRVTIAGVTRSSHLSSTVHQFSERREETRAPPMTVYHIPESNVGFQLMLKDGWDRDRGLGPDGNGIKFPPKTTLKRNRKGLGHSSKLKSRITHFGPGDVAAVETRRRQTKDRQPRTIDKYERNRKELRQKEMEIEFRKQFSALE